MREGCAYMISYNHICCLDQTTILIHHFSMNTRTNPPLPKKKYVPSVRNHRPGLHHGLNHDRNGPQMVGFKRKINRQLDFWYNLFKQIKLFLFPQNETSNGSTIQEQTNVFSFPFFSFFLFFQKINFIFIFCV